jgi:hypothetical protein
MAGNEGGHSTSADQRAGQAPRQAHRAPPR